jgi:hypothetical protein
VKLLTVPLSELVIEDERSLQHVGLYRDLKQVLADDGQRFRIPAGRGHLPWPRALLLNLTFWSADAPTDVLCDRHVPADVLAHAAWHHLARKAFGDGAPSADALFLGEAVASAFDLYLVGRVLPVAPESEFITTQVPAMTDAALEMGASEDDVEALLQSVVDDPEAAFEDLRALLFDASTSLVQARDVDDAAARLDALGDRRFAPLLHHYELSNWSLYARAYRPDALAADPAVRAMDAAMRAAKPSITWLESNWLAPRMR